MTEHLDVVIVGAGISGISAAWHLQDRCPSKSYAILERRENLGGTWDLFKYPGIRSDSDMFTLGFRFKPWTSAKAIADGPSILDYIKETAAENGIDKHIRYRHKVVAADWSDADNRWTVTRRPRRRGNRRSPASFLFACSGYYNYDEGYSPKFAGLRGLRGHHRAPAALARGSRLRGQEDRRHRQRCHRGDSDSRAGRIPAPGTSPCCSARRPTSASLPDVDPIAVRLNKYAADEGGLRGQPVEEPSSSAPPSTSIGRALPELHAQDADDHGAAAAARGLRRREALRPALQPVGRATVPGAQR